MSDANRPDPVAAYWDDYLRAIEPDAGASRRVRRSLDRALVDRRRAAPVEAPAQPMPRAAAAFFVIKSSALSVGLALATLGGLHVGARALAPAELPTVEPRAPVEPISAHEPIATPEARRPAASLERPSIAAPLPADAAPAIAPVRRATTRADAKPNAAPAESTPAASPPLDALRAELLGGLMAGGSLAGGDVDLGRTGLEEALGDHLADAARTAGDQRHLAVQREQIGRHARLPFVVGLHTRGRRGPDRPSPLAHLTWKGPAGPITSV